MAFSFDGEPESDVRNFQSAPASGAASAPGDDMLAEAIQAVLYDRCYRAALQALHRPRIQISNSRGDSLLPMAAASVGTEVGSSISSAPTGRRSCARATVNASLSRAPSFSTRRPV